MPRTCRCSDFGFRHAEPNLETVRPHALGSPTAFGVLDAAADRHPLETGRSERFPIAHRVGVPAHAFHHVAQDIHSVVRVPRDVEPFICIVSVRPL